MEQSRELESPVTKRLYIHIPCVLALFVVIFVSSLIFLFFVIRLGNQNILDSYSLRTLRYNTFEPLQNGETVYAPDSILEDYFHFGCYM